MKQNVIAKYVYFPTGRKIWFDLAKSLYDEEIAEPVIWIGDNRHKSIASQTFSNTKVLDFYDVHCDISQIALSIENDVFIRCYREIFSSEVKAKAIKMMDRHDPSGAFHYIERINQFHFLLTYSIKLIEDEKPDFLIMCESPHSPFQFILSEVCDWFNIKSVCFFSWGVVPLISARNKNGMVQTGERISSEIRVKIEVEIQKYISKFEKKDEDIEPEYIKNQKEIDKKKKKISSYFSLIKNKLSSKKVVTLNRRFKVNSFSSFLTSVFERQYKKTVQIELRNELKKRISYLQNLNFKYVYFPLHYEPERTTNPDGGDYYDQILAISSLRAELPNDHLIVVKEHYSQFTNALQGYKGRRPSFYKLLNNIEGVVLLDDSVSSKELILQAEFTCSITGTAALESALYGKAGVTMGQSWFEGAPGVYKFDDSSTIQNIVSGDLAGKSRDEISNWFKKRIDFALFGTINPSNEKYFSHYYDNYSCESRNELGSLKNLLKNEFSDFYKLSKES